MSTMNPISIGPHQPNDPPIQVTERAFSELVKIFKEEQPGDGTGLRLRVAKGGCSGMSYEMDFGARQNDDIEVDLDDLKIFIAAESTVFMKGTTLDYHGGLQGRGFVFSNPNARKTCSCGDSFGI
jgi:iron-sulfur cluster assembly protein